MNIQRVCKICGKTFTAIKTTQFFCSRKCFKKDYYLKTKIHIQELNQNPKYPSKCCAYCETTSNLNFDPIKYPRLFETWSCPICGVNNKMVWKYQDFPNSHYLIHKLIINLPASTQGIVQPKYQIYQIPITHPDQCTTNILTLACEVINILDIQKLKRKKIVFS